MFRLLKSVDLPSQSPVEDKPIFPKFLRPAVLVQQFFECVDGDQFAIISSSSLDG